MNVLIVGLGSIAQKHINALKQIGDFNIYALRSTLNSKQIEGITNIYGLQELKQIDINFAIISNPTSEHKKTIENLLSLKCPLFIEKPIYHKLDIGDILTQVSKANILTYVACNLRFLDCLKFIKLELDTKKKIINEVNSYCGSYLPDWRKDDFRKIYSAIPALGGGVHIDLIHELDYLYWFFGEPSDIEATLKSKSSLNIESVDFANYCFNYDNFCSNITLNYYRRDYKRTLEILFNDETWLVDLPTNSIKCGEKIVFSSNQSIMDTYSAQMQYFVDLVKQNKKNSFNSIYDAYNVLKMCLHDTKG